MPSKKVFISYRRKLSGYMALLVYQHLRSKGYDVFMDVETMFSGEFPSIILRQIEARSHFLVILTPGSLERTADEGDWLRREIEYAIEKERNVVPVMAEDFSFEEEETKLPNEEFPGELNRLIQFNGVNVPKEYFEAAMEKLTGGFLRKEVEAPIAQVPEEDRAIVRDMIDAADREATGSLRRLWFMKREFAMSVGGIFLVALAFFGFPVGSLTVDISADPTTLETGRYTLLSWSSSNATEVRLEPGMGIVEPVGSRVVSPETDVTYRLVARNDKDETEEASVLVRVIPVPPTISLSADPPAIERGQSTTLTWDVADADEVELEPDIGSVEQQDSVSLTPQNDVTYTIVASVPGGTRRDSVSIGVSEPPMSVRLTAEPRTLERGNATRLSWTSANATEVRLEPGFGIVQAEGSRMVSPEETITYRLVASSDKGTADDSVLVRVIAPSFVTIDGLMWTTADNGQDIDWNDATAYCDDLSLGNIAWKLPTLAQLRDLFDRTVSYEVPDASRVYVKDPILLTAPGQWSSAQPAPDGGSASGYTFADGNPFRASVATSDNVRALCVPDPEG